MIFFYFYETLTFLSVICKLKRIDAVNALIARTSLKEIEETSDTLAIFYAWVKCNSNIDPKLLLQEEPEDNSRKNQQSRAQSRRANRKNY